jgi:hypothetical protein
MVSAFTIGKDGLPQVNKDPNAALDYTIDWSDWLGADVIAASVWTLATPARALRTRRRRPGSPAARRARWCG